MGGKDTLVADNAPIAGIFTAVQSNSVVPFLVPMVGALAAFMLNRGSGLRRARAAALEDLQLHERAETLLGPDDPSIDQIRAHARESLRAYSTRRAADARRPTVWLSMAVVVLTSLVLGALSVKAEFESGWAFVAVGVIAGLAGMGAESELGRLHVRRALRKFPTRSDRTSPK